MYKNNVLKINKNDIAYSKKSDRILFELDKDLFTIFIKKDEFKIIKENSDSIFSINNKKSSLYLKSQDILLPIKIIFCNIITNIDQYTINYQIETDDEPTCIEIIL